MHQGESTTVMGVRRRWRWAAAALSVVLLAASACGDDDEDVSDGADDGGEASSELFGPADVASGEPVRIGLVSDGASAAIDNTDELRAGAATVEFLNEHRGGIAGRPIELVTCETGADPAGGTDCANQMVEEDVVAVTLNQSAVMESVWQPLHAAGVPTLFFQGNTPALLADTQSSFNIVHPLATLFGLPISVAQAEDVERIAFVNIDVPAALSTFESVGPAILQQAGLEYDLVRIPPGTADMTPQMQAVVESGAGLVHVIGNDSFCIAAFNGLRDVGYEGEVTSITQCVTDATIEASPPEILDGMSLTSTMALGAEDDPTFQLYEAVMEEYSDVDDVANANTMGAYVVVSALAAALEGLEGDVTPASIIEALGSMPEMDLPGGGGITFQCGGSVSSTLPAVCSNRSLRVTLGADGRPAEFEVIDPSDFLAL